MERTGEEIGNDNFYRFQFLGQTVRDFIEQPPKQGVDAEQMQYF